MKKFIIPLLLLLGCTDQSFEEAQNNAKSSGDGGGGITPQFACDYTYKFNISQNSTLTQVQQAVKVDLHIKNKIVSHSNGDALVYSTAITWISGTITFRMINTGSATFRYKASPAGAWITVLPGTTSTFIKPTYLKRDDCTAAITFLDFTVNTERTNCGPMLPGGNHYNPIVQIAEITNGHNSDFSLIGTNWGTLTCPL